MICITGIYPRRSWVVSQYVPDRENSVAEHRRWAWCVIRRIKVLISFFGRTRKGFAPIFMTSFLVKNGKSLRTVTKPSFPRKNGIRFRSWLTADKPLCRETPARFTTCSTVSFTVPPVESPCRCGTKRFGRTNKNRFTGEQREPIDKAYYICQTYNRLGKNAYTSHKLEARDLYDLVLKDIQNLAKTALKGADAFY